MVHLCKNKQLQNMKEEDVEDLGGMRWARSWKKRKKLRLNDLNRMYKLTEKYMGSSVRFTKSENIHFQHTYSYIFIQYLKNARLALSIHENVSKNGKECKIILFSLKFKIYQ